MITRLTECRFYAFYAGHLIPDRDLIDYGNSLFLKTGLLSEAYNSWHAKPTADKTWLIFQEYWKREVRLAKNTLQAAGQLRYGMHDGEVEEADDAFKQMESTIGQFTQNTATKDQQINNLMHQCEAQRQQMAMMNQQQQ